MTAKNSILKLHQVIQKTSLTRDEITKKISVGTFPKPFKLNKCTNAWLESQIDDWLQNQNGQAHQNGLKNFDFQKFENLLRRFIFLIQLGKFAYSYIKSEIANVSL